MLFFTTVEQKKVFVSHKLNNAVLLDSLILYNKVLKPTPYF